MQFYEQAHFKSSNDDDELLKHMNDLDIDEFLDDDDDDDLDLNGDMYSEGTNDSQDWEDFANVRDHGDITNNGGDDDNVSDISDIFDKDAHLLIGLETTATAVATATVEETQQLQLLSLDEVPYSRDLTQINVPTEDRINKLHQSRNNGRMLVDTGVRGSRIHTRDSSDHRRERRNRDEVRRIRGGDRDDSRDQRNRNRTIDREKDNLPGPDRPIEEITTRGVGKLVIFDDDPKPSQRRKRPPRIRPSRFERGGEPPREYRDRDYDRNERPRGNDGIDIKKSSGSVNAMAPMVNVSTVVGPDNVGTEQVKLPPKTLFDPGKEQSI